MNKLLTIIVTYNGMQWLERCLASVRNSETHSDIFIVDNGSTDGSIEYIKNNYPEAILIESKENLGFGRANNLGFKYAVKNGYENVYLLNQDAWIEPGLLGRMVDVARLNPEYGILSPLQVNREQTKLDKNFSSWIPAALSSDLLCGCSLKDVYETKFTMAAHWLIPVSKLHIVGGFSPAFRHYGEDNNLIDRMHFKGFKNGIVPSVKGVHDREFRPLSKGKSQYINYVLTIVMLNNPLIKGHFVKLMTKTFKKMLHPNDFNIKYAFKSFGDYIKSRKYKRQYKETGPYLD